MQNGVVRIELVAPDEPGALTGHLELQGRQSNAITIDYASGISSFDAELEQVGVDIVLRIDSAIDPNGAFVADGTEVSWADHRTQIRRGAAEIRLPAALAPDDDALVQILGLERVPGGSRS